MNFVKGLLTCAMLCAPSTGYLPDQSGPQGLMTLDAEGIKALLSHRDVLGVQFDLLFLQRDPSYLDDKNFMRYFIMLNNCKNPQAGLLQQKKFNSEFDYPDMVKFYKDSAPRILQTIPTSFTAAMRSYPDPHNPQREQMIDLGDYDRSSGSFPFVDISTKGVSIDFSNAVIGGRQGLSSFCGAPLLELGNGTLSGQSPVYIVQYPKVTLTHFALSEAAARQYVSSPGVGAAGTGRSVTLWMDIEVLPGAPQIAPIRGSSSAIFATFSGKLNKITVVDSMGHPVGIVYP